METTTELTPELTREIYERHPLAFEEWAQTQTPYYRGFLLDVKNDIYNKRLADYNLRNLYDHFDKLGIHGVVRKYNSETWMWFIEGDHTQQAGNDILSRIEAEVSMFKTCFRVRNYQLRTGLSVRKEEGK